MLSPPLTPPEALERPSARAKAKPRMPKRIRPHTAVLDLLAYRQGYDSATLLTRLKDKSQKEFVNDISILYHAFRRTKRCIVITGAGISVAAGIPDFRSQEGLFKVLKSTLNLKTSGKEMFDASVYQNEDSLSSFHTTIRDLHELCGKAQPTAFHRLLDEMAQEGRLERLYTQNIDCLDTKIASLRTQVPLQGSPWPKTIQLHGSLATMVCSRCQATKELRPELFVGGLPPTCEDCEELDAIREVAGKRTLGIGKIRPRIVLYNEDNPDATAIGQVSLTDLACRPDALIVCGTTLKIPGVKRIVKEMSQAVHNANGPVLWLNIDEPPAILKLKEFEACFDMCVRGDCQAVAQILDDYEESQRQKLQQTNERREKRKLKDIHNTNQVITFGVTKRKDVKTAVKTAANITETKSDHSQQKPEPELCQVRAPKTTTQPSA